MPLTDKYKLCKYTYLLCIWLGCFSFPAAADSLRIRVGADPWCPYNCIPGTERPGVMIELAREALALSGYVLEYQTVNWARAKIMVQSGELDGIVGMAYTAKSKELYFFPGRPLGESQICLFKRQLDDWHYRGIASLDSKVFGWINDYGFSTDPLDAWVKEHKNTPQVLTVAGKDTHMRLFKLLQLKRIDVFAEDRAVIAYELYQSGLQNEIVQAGCIEQIEDIYIAFSLASEHKEKWAEALDSGLDKLNQSGRYLEIIQKYGLSSENWAFREIRP